MAMARLLQMGCAIGKHDLNLQNIKIHEPRGVVMEQDCTIHLDVETHYTCFGAIPWSVHTKKYVHNNIPISPSPKD